MHLFSKGSKSQKEENETNHSSVPAGTVNPSSMIIDDGEPVGPIPPAAAVQNSSKSHNELGGNTYENPTHSPSNQIPASPQSSPAHQTSSPGSSHGHKDGSPKDKEKDEPSVMERFKEKFHRDKKEKDKDTKTHKFPENSNDTPRYVNSISKFKKNN